MHKLNRLYLCLLLPLSAIADPSTDLYTLNLTELMKIKVLVASKTEQTIEKAPSTVTVFTRQDIKRLGITRVADILRYVPGFQITRNDSNNLGHSFQARGRFTFSGRSVLVLLDNQRLNDDWSGGANWTNHDVSTLNIKQIEVIRGPGSALYGSNAFNAVINIITDPTLNESGVEYGSFNRKTVHVATANKFDGLETSLFINYFKDQGEDYQTVEGPTNDPIEGYEVSGYLKQDNLQFRLRHVNRKAQNFYEFGGITNDVNATVSKQTAISLGYKYQDIENLDLEVFAYYSDRYQKGFFQPLNESVMSSLFDAGIAQHPSAVIAGPLYGLVESGVNFDGRYKLNNKHNLSFGLSYRQPDMKTIRNHGNHELVDITNVLVLGQPGQIRYYGYNKIQVEFGDERHRTNLGLYVQDQVTLSPDLEGTFGVRYDHYDDFGSTTNPRASIVYSYNTQHSFKLIHGEAFRAPSLGEITVRNNPVSTSNPDVMPEEVATSEFAWVYRNDDFRMISTFYYSKFKNVIEHTLNLDLPPLTIPVNSGTLEVSGIELETRQQFNDTFSLDVNLSHNIKLEQDPQTLARNAASIALNANFGQWEANFNVTYKGEVEHRRYTDPSFANLEIADLDDYWLVNFNARYKWTDSIIGKVGISNLFDRAYHDTLSSAETVYEGLPNRGRQLSVAIEWIW